MTPSSSGYLRILGRAIDSHDEELVLALVETAIKEDPSYAGILTWSCLATSDNVVSSACCVVRFVQDRI